jgi:hypothetical protein
MEPPLKRLVNRLGAFYDTHPGITTVLGIPMNV